MFPIDTIKTYMQAVRPGSGGASVHLGMGETISFIMSKNGIKGLFRGISAMATGAAPAHAMQFATYEFCKKSFGGKRDGPHPMASGAAGVCATVVNDAIMTPMDAVKQRLQLGVKEYKGLRDCVQTVVRKEGITALYAGYTTTLTMNIPFMSIYFASYESLRHILKRGSEKDFDPIAHCLAGGGSGMVAAALTNPLDVCKTRLQTQGDIGVKYKGMLDTLQTIWREEGRAGYLRGLPPRMALHSTSAAICWLTYEWIKYLLQGVGIS
eukprot:TRINITY_DN4569_c0_g1_i1.p1 TRINITY_DN4569_c0_g1~~TRINITY_DN4569_c0_g1_i1.p1  ORF type:complete len:267 (-),score=58.15 TRINITY_DN4569_c0_g1_i1:133-933(-)